MSNGWLKKPSPPPATLEDKFQDVRIVAEEIWKWFPELSESQIKMLGSYYIELMKFNMAVNLIATSTIKNAEVVHFADSISAVRMVVKGLVPGKPVWDLGSGNGFPGLVLGILNPAIKVVLFDRDSRKVDFLRHVVNHLKLSNVETRVGQIEDVPPGSLHNVISRGFAPLSRSLLVCRKQLALGGRFFHLKGDGWATELGAVPSQLFSFWSPSLYGQYQLPETGSAMAVVLTERIQE